MPEAGEILFVFNSVVTVCVAGKLTVASVVVSVAPDGTVNVSPLSPKVKDVPLLGDMHAI